MNMMSAWSMQHIASCDHVANPLPYFTYSQTVCQLTPVLIEELVQLLFVHSCLWGFNEVAYWVCKEVISCCIYSPIIE